MAGFLDELETQLVDAADRPHLHLTPEPTKSRGRRLRGVRLAIVMVATLLAITTIALAASGVILTGSPVHPEQTLSPNVGEGVPVPGASTLLPLRIADPQGGLPWGMRIVRTTRNEVCLQVGRVQNGQLGELGIDGAFHDDGRFHPLPSAALPADVYHGEAVGTGWIANANTTCQLPGEPSVNEHVGLDRSAASNRGASPRSASELRDIDFGLLGPAAVRVNYRSAAGEAREPVVPGVGAYLVVEASRAGEQAESGSASLGTFGDLQPVAPLTTITYRLGGKLCERGPSELPGVVEHLAHPCSRPHFTNREAKPVELHEPIQVELQRRGLLITGVRASFKAPYAVTNAGEQYTIFIPGGSCSTSELRPGVDTGGSTATLNRNLARGQTVIHEFRAQELFYSECPQNKPKGKFRGKLLPQVSVKVVPRRLTVVEVQYETAGEPLVVVGRTTVRQPPGTRVTRPVFVGRVR